MGTYKNKTDRKYPFHEGDIVLISPTLVHDTEWTEGVVSSYVEKGLMGEIVTAQTADGQLYFGAPELFKLERAFEDEVRPQIVLDPSVTNHDDDIIEALKRVDEHPVSKKHLFLILCAANLLNAAVKTQHYKRKISYASIKPKVQKLASFCIEHHSDKDFIEQLYIEGSGACVYIRCYGLQFSFHNVNMDETLQNFAKSSKNKMVPWDGVRLQMIASQLFKMANESFLRNLDEIVIRDRINALVESYKSDETDVVVNSKQSGIIGLISADYKIGDAIRIACQLGIKEGIIQEFLDSRIKLIPIRGGRPFYIKDDSINDWEEYVSCEQLDDIIHSTQPTESLNFYKPETTQSPDTAIAENENVRFVLLASVARHFNVDSTNVISALKEIGVEVSDSPITSIPTEVLPLLANYYKSESDKNQGNIIDSDIDSSLKPRYDFVSKMSEVYELEAIDADAIISTNAVIVEIQKDSVLVKTDDGNYVHALKGPFVGYSKSACEEGKRVHCWNVNNSGFSHQTILEMTYGELLERLQRAVDTKPKARVYVMFVIIAFIKSMSTTKESKRLLSEMRNQTVLLRDNIDTVVTQNPISQESVYDETLYNFIVSKVTENISSDTAKIKALQQEYTQQYGATVKRKLIKQIINELYPIVEQIDDDIEIPANCHIYKYFKYYRNGAAKDDVSGEIRFNDSVVVEQELVEELQFFDSRKPGVLPIPAICIYKKQAGQDFATFITKPGKTSEIKKRIEKLRLSGRSAVADELEKYILSKGYVVSANTTDPEDSATILEQARKHRLIKHLDEAERLFKVLIEREYELDAVVKDLATIYQERHQYDLAIQLMHDNLDKFENKVKAYNWLASLYLGNKDFKGALTILQQALQVIPSSELTPKQRAYIEKQIKICSNKKGKKTYFGIPSRLVRNDAENNESEILSFVADKSFDEQILYLRQRQGELRESPEVVKYYLEQIKLIEEKRGITETDKELVADYCRFKARNLFFDKKADSAREYLLEAIRLIPNNPVNYYNYLKSICMSSDRVVETYQDDKYDFAKIFDENHIEQNEESLRIIFELLSVNSQNSRTIVRYLYQNEGYRDWICEELEVDDSNITPESFIDYLFAEIKDRKEEQHLFENSLSALLEKDNAFEILSYVVNISTFPVNISSSNVSMLKTFAELCNLYFDVSKIQSFEDQNNFLNTKCKDAKKSLQSQLLSIPTQISIFTIMPLLIKVDVMIGEYVNKNYEASLPNPVVSAADDAYYDNGVLEIQLKVSNNNSLASNMYSPSIKLIQINDNSVSCAEYEFGKNIGGGNSEVAPFTTKNVVVDTDIVKVAYVLYYQDALSKPYESSGTVEISIGHGENFIPFENPFLGNVKGNAVKDKTMFYGRDEKINTICKFVQEQNKGYVLWGQKRSGKSSVLYHITKQLIDDGNAFAVYFSLGMNIIQDSSSEKESLANLYYTILSEIGRAIKLVNRDVYKEKVGILRRAELDQYPQQTFQETLDQYRDVIHDDLHYKYDRIILVIDEFTYLYYFLIQKQISPGIMLEWKRLIEADYFSFVFAGQDAMPRFMDEYKNIFGSMESEELTYIDESSARDLIEKPIWDENKNASRYNKEAVDRIVQLTACNPFYIQILCSEMVKYAHKRQRVPITVLDVNELVKQILSDESTISRKDFDNLVSCGEAKLDIISADQSIAVLKAIAFNTRNSEYCDLEEVKVYQDEELMDKIVGELRRRRVIVSDPNYINQNRVKIVVELFKLWLLKHHE